MENSNGTIIVMPNGSALSETSATTSDSGIFLNNQAEGPLKSYEVVRKEYVSHAQEPSITFVGAECYVSQSCMGLFPGVDTVLFLINKESKSLVLLPCAADEPGAMRWCRMKSGKRHSRHLVGRMFCAKVFSLMKWNAGNRYRSLGRVVTEDGFKMLQFDLRNSEVFPLVYSDKQKLTIDRTARYLESWHDQFGMPYEEHKRQINTRILGEYALITVREAKNSADLSLDNKPQTLMLEEADHNERT